MQTSLHRLNFCKDGERTTTINPMGGSPYQAQVWRVWCGCGNWHNKRKGHTNPEVEAQMLAAFGEWKPAVINNYVIGTEEEKAYKSFLQLWLQEHLAKYMISYGATKLSVIEE